MKKRFGLEDLNMRKWRPFYIASYLALSLSLTAAFMINDQNIRLIILVLCQILYLPWVINEFKKAMNKKVKP